jgi:cytochrome oxidase Cu insertion factor (SCO1/SenC/PrrC family)
MKMPVFTPRSLAVSLLALGLAGVVGTAVWTQGVRSRWEGREERPLEGLRVFGTVPAFSLMERSGRRVTPADLQGKIWIANFIYTHCTETCPLQTAKMAQLQADLTAETDIRLISITVDPVQDTPEVLAEYAARFGADRDRWLFLTGEKRAIYTLAQEGFRLSVVDPEEAVQDPGDRGSPSDRPATPRKAPSPDGKGRRASATRILLEAAVRVFDPPPAMAHPGHAGKPFFHSSRFVLGDRQARIRGYYHSNDEEALGRLRRDVRVLLHEKQDANRQDAKGASGPIRVGVGT